MPKDHVKLRQTRWGRWLPAVFNALNLGLWIVTVVAAGAWDLLMLAILPLPALLVYVVRTQRKVP